MDDQEKKTAQEIQVQEQQIKQIIDKELKQIKINQTFINILQTIVIILITIQIVRRNAIFNDLQHQMDILKQLLLRF